MRKISIEAVIGHYSTDDVYGRKIESAIRTVSGKETGEDVILASVGRMANYDLLGYMLCWGVVQPKRRKNWTEIHAVS